MLLWCFSKIAFFWPSVRGVRCSHILSPAKEYNSFVTFCFSLNCERFERSCGYTLCVGWGDVRCKRSLLLFLIAEAAIVALLL